MEFTVAQRQAIDYKGKNLLVSAAAGSGKTATLTEKIVDLIVNNGVEINKILVVTFTRAAAAEMKERIRNILISKKNEYIYTNKGLARRLNNELAKLGGADICTIDSFLYKNIRKYFPLIGLSAETVIASEKELAELKNESMRSAVDHVYSGEFAKNNNILWSRLLNTLSQTRDTFAVDKILIEIADDIENKNISYESLKSPNCSADDASALGMFFRSSAGIWLRGYLKSFVRYYKNTFLRIKNELINDTAVWVKYEKNVNCDINICTCLELNLCEKCEFDGIKRAFVSVRFERLTNISKENKSQACEKYKAVRDEFKAKIKKLNDDFFVYSEDIYQKDMELIHLFNGFISDVLSEYYGRLESRKCDLAVMSYRDLEVYSFTLLNKYANVAGEIAQKYQYVFVDEYQDTNDMQDEILSLVSKSAMRMMVGDVKQSIYRFRGADPSVFNRYRNEWPAHCPDDLDDQDCGNSIFMSENFRCSDEIVGLTNQISGKIFEHSDITFDSHDLLVHSREEKSEVRVPVSLCLIEKKRKKKGDDDTEVEVNLEARYVAKCINMQIGAYDEKIGRIVTGKDIAVIMRSPSSHAEDFKDEMAKYGIKTNVKKEIPLEKFAIIKLIMCALEVINNPLDDIYFAGLACSELFGFSIEDLERIRFASGDLPLFCGVLQILENSSDFSGLENNKKLTLINDFLLRESAAASTLAPQRFVEKLVNEGGFFGSVEALGEPGGVDAVYKFLDLAKRYDGSIGSVKGAGALADFLDFARREIKSASSDDAGDKIIDEDSVSIISIHSSKGLEFPIVYLCEVNRKRSIIDENKPIIIDRDFGMSMKISDPTGLAIFDTLARKVASLKVGIESTYEEMRMLYVGMTRAKDRLVMTGVVSDAEKEIVNGWIRDEFADHYSVVSADSYLDWILMCRESELLKINILGCDEIVGDYEDKSTETNADVKYSQLEINEVDNKWEYKGRLLTKIPKKIAAGKLRVGFIDEILAEDATDLDYDSELSDVDKSVEVNDMVLPNFMSGGGRVSGSEIGNAMHMFMQFANIYTINEDTIEGEIERLVSEEYLPRAYAELINRRQIRQFLRGELCKKMRKSDFIEREFRFNVNVLAENYAISDEIKSVLREFQQKITVQGVVDCVLRDPEDGRLILVDYKTDFLTDSELKNRSMAREKLRGRHENQLIAYREICSRIFEEDIARVYIYSTALAEMIEI